MTAPIRSMPELTIVQHIIAHRRSFHRARCRVKAWKITEAQAWQLADETSVFLGTRSTERRHISEIVEATKRGEIRMMGAKVIVR
jgi:hypothetical protein